MKHGISVVIVVYNEEARVERAVKAFYEYDEIVIIDKSSTDLTVEIAKRCGAKVVEIPYTDHSDLLQLGVDAASYDWVFFVTASDVPHPKFTYRLYRLIDNEKFNKKYNRIVYPCTIHVLGVESPYSIYDQPYRKTIAKRDDIELVDRVHDEINVRDERLYSMKWDRMVALHHLTHETADTLLEREFRYTKMEFFKDTPQTYRQSTRNMFKCVFRGVKMKFWKLGWHGFVLLLSLVNYHIIMMIRLLERDMGDVAAKYNEYAGRLIYSENKRFRNKAYKKLYDKDKD